MDEYDQNLDKFQESFKSLRIELIAKLLSQFDNQYIIETIGLVNHYFRALISNEKILFVIQSNLKQFSPLQKEQIQNNFEKKDQIYFITKYYVCQCQICYETYPNNKNFAKKFDRNTCDKCLDTIMKPNYYISANPYFSKKSEDAFSTQLQLNQDGYKNQIYPKLQRLHDFLIKKGGLVLFLEEEKLKVFTEILELLIKKLQKQHQLSSTKIDVYSRQQIYKFNVLAFNEMYMYGVLNQRINHVNCHPNEILQLENSKYTDEQIRLNSMLKEL